MGEKIDVLSALGITTDKIKLWTKQRLNDMNSKNLITDKEHRVIFNPPRTINKSEINKALSSINREMDEAAEEFY